MSNNSSRQNNLPPISAKQPHRRHWLERLTRHERAAKRNSLILPGVQVLSDVDGINRGFAVRSGDFYKINDRMYFLESGGRLVPVRGPGIVEHVVRMTYRALIILVTYGGPTERAMREIDLNRGINYDDKQQALQLWSLRTRR